MSEIVERGKAWAARRSAARSAANTAAWERSVPAPPIRRSGWSSRAVSSAYAAQPPPVGAIGPAVRSAAHAGARCARYTVWRRPQPAVAPRPLQGELIVRLRALPEPRADSPADPRGAAFGALVRPLTARAYEVARALRYAASPSDVLPGKSGAQRYCQRLSAERLSR